MSRKFPSSTDTGIKMSVRSTRPAKRSRFKGKFSGSSHLTYTTHRAMESYGTVIIIANGEYVSVNGMIEARLENKSLILLERLKLMTLANNQTLEESFKLAP